MVAYKYVLKFMVCFNITGYMYYLVQLTVQINMTLGNYSDILICYILNMGL